MFPSKSLFFICLVQFFAEYTHGQAQRKYFRKDYTFIEETQSFYKFYTIPTTFHEASKTCSSQGAKLFFAEDQDELNAVIKFWTQPAQTIIIGVSSLFAKRVFMTVDGRSLIDVYSNWSPGEPNDVGGNENCIVMDKKGNMNDVPCDVKQPFICKKTLSTLQWNEQCQTPYKNYVLNENLERCYKFFLTPLNWIEAFAVCSAEESYLAVINSEYEMEFLKNMTWNAPKDQVKGNYLAGVVMLGFNNSNKQGWLTVKGTTLEESGYSRWGLAQPNIGDKYLCGAMFYNGELTYGTCTERSFFICEKEFKSGFEERFGD